MTNKQAQHLLGYLGYYVGTVDGEWGSGSRASCTAFQRDAGITPDGYHGPETWKALKKAIANDLTKPVEDATDVNVGNKTGTFWDEIEFFTREEFRCQCGGQFCNGFPTEPDETLVRLANDLRKQAGRPAHRSSGLRCRTWNTVQKGVANSKHMYGKALDFFIEGVSGPQLLAMAQADPRTSYAYIINGQYVHIDVD